MRGHARLVVGRRFESVRGALQTLSKRSGLSSLSLLHVVQTLRSAAEKVDSPGDPRSNRPGVRFC